MPGRLGVRMRVSARSIASPAYNAYPLFLPDFNKTWIFSTDFRKKHQVLSKIRPLGGRVVPCGDRRTDGQTDVTELIVPFRNFAKEPNKELKYKMVTLW
jgi:hypothetical protein